MKPFKNVLKGMCVCVYKKMYVSVYHFIHLYSMYVYNHTYVFVTYVIPKYDTHKYEKLSKICKILNATYRAVLHTICVNPRNHSNFYQPRNG